MKSQPSKVFNEKPHHQSPQPPPQAPTAPPEATTHPAVQERRRQIIEACRQRPRSVNELIELTGASHSTITADTKYLQQHFPQRFTLQRQGRFKSWLWLGAPVTPVAVPPQWLDEDELLALIAARGLLRDPASGPTEQGGAPYPGLLDGALVNFLQRLGLHQIAADIAPEAIQVSRFAARSESAAVLKEVLGALLHHRHLRFHYQNLQAEERQVHATPQRLVNFRGEWHLFAWAAATAAGKEGCVKQYRLSRMHCVGACSEEPAGAPPYLRQQALDERLDEAFNATGSAELSQRHRIVLAVSPTALPHLEGRRWGGNCRWDTEAPDLPPGWRRLRFWTSGLAECQHWLLGLGTSIRAELPPALLSWLQQQAAELADTYRSSAPMSKTERPNRKLTCDSPE